MTKDTHQYSHKGSLAKLIKVTDKNSRNIRGTEFPIKYHLDYEGNPSYRTSAIEGLFEDLGNQNEFRSILDRHGQVIIKNLGSTDADLYSRLIEKAFHKDHTPFDQVGVLGASRKDVSDNVTTVNPLSAPNNIYGHQEFSRFDSYPTVLSFFSQISVKSLLTNKQNLGQSITLHATELFDRVNEKYPKFIEDLHKKGLYLSQIWKYPDDPGSLDYSWLANYAFGKDINEHDLLDIKKEKAIKLASERVSKDVEFLEDNSLLIHQHTKPIRIHPRNNLPIIFSSLPTYYAPHYFDKSKPLTIRYDDGSSIPEEYLDFLFETAVDIEYTHTFEDGDLLIIDNYLVYHGRNPYDGKREVLASFWDEPLHSKKYPLAYTNIA